ncbi:hypothetical protein JCM3775_004144 [Rhodotorula graminis]
MKLSLVAAVAALSSLASAVPMYATSVVVDDASPQVVFSGQWTHLKNQGSGVNAGTLSYSNDPNARLTIPYGAKGYYGFKFATGAKVDRSTFGISVGPTFTIHGNAKGTCKTNCAENNVVLDVPRLTVDDGSSLEFFNADPSGASFIAFDAITLYTSP